MSLQIWLPLRGNLTNQGLSTSTITNSGAGTSTSGKIGSCYTFNGSSSYIKFSNPITSANTEFSICCWLKLNSAGKTVTMCTMRTSVGNGIALFKTSGNKIRFDDNGQATFSSHTYTSTDWVHVCVTRSSSAKKLYINGSLVETITTVGSMANIATTGSIGASTTNGSSPDNYTNGSMNDFRIYDHCLSAKEVKEISKGLVCHYKLSGPGGKNIALNTGVNTDWGWSMKAGNYTKTYEEANDGKWCVLSRGSTAQSGWSVITYGSINPSSSEYVANASYTISFDVISKYACTLTCKLLESDGTDALTSASNFSVPANTRTHAVFNVTAVSSLPSSRSQIVYITGQNSSTDSVLKFKNLKIEKGTRATPWCPNAKDAAYTTLGYNSTTEYDCSGYGNHGTKSGTISWDSDSPRYVGSYNFASGSYINCGTGGKVTDAITVNIWCYMSTWAADPRPISCTEGGGWNFESNSGNISFALYVANVGYKNAASTKTWASLSSGWHMFTGTYDGSTTKLYLDGTLLTSKANGQSAKTAIGYHASNAIFIHAEASTNSSTPASANTNACKMSDCRIYATALSADDVKALYNTAASIDNSGVLCAYEFVEG